MKLDENSFVIADTHFGHENISKHEPIRKQSAYNHGFNHVDDLMIHQWNSVISNDDTVFHLGDLAFKHKNLAYLSNSLNGNKILLLGNHDKSGDVNILKENGWKIIDNMVLNIKDSEVKRVMQKLHQNTDFKKIDKRLLCCYIDTILDKRIMFTHFPLYNDNPYDEKYDEITNILEYAYEALKCDLNIHGHTHSQGAKEVFCKSVCVELIDFQPVRLKDFFQGTSDA